MKNKIIYFTLISISLLIFSCDTDSDLGYNILPEDDLLDLQIIDSTTINVYTVSTDSITSNNPSSLLLGEYIDPIFGYSKAGFVCQYGILESPRFTDDYVIDSAVLYLIPDTISLNNYGNFSNPQDLKVYRLNTDLDDTLSYFSNHDVSEFILGELIGVKTFTPEIIEGEPIDTIIPIRLSDIFAQSFKTLETTTLNDDFKEFFKGVYISSESPGHDGAIFKYKINSDALIKVYSHLNEDEYIFEVSSDISTNVKFNVFSHDYSLATFYDDIGNETIQDSVAYIQPMSGVKAKIIFPFINDLKKLGDIAINRAELIVNTAPSYLTQEDEFPLSETMVLTGISDDGNYSLLPEYTSGSLYRSVAYNDGIYKFDIAGYIRAVIDGNIINNGLYLFAGSGNTNLNRTVITTGNNSNRMKLVISYTKL